MVVWQTHHTVVALLVVGGVSRAAAWMQLIAVFVVRLGTTHSMVETRSASMLRHLARATPLQSDH